MKPGGVRDAAFFGFTRSICAECTRDVDAHLLLRDGRVWMDKRCPDHGHQEVEISSDAEYWVRSLSYTKPGSVPLRFATPVDKGCPHDCGLCEDHLQHTCTPILEINDVCDLTCPVCIVRNSNGWKISLEQFKTAVDALVATEGQAALLLLSGGEPTLHPQLFEFADYVLRGPHEGLIGKLIVSTHGKRLADDRRFAERFKASGAYASLQFDTLREGVYPTLRGEELLDTKMRCLEVIRELDIPAVLVPTVSAGDNSGELGDLIQLGLDTPQVCSIAIQPMAHVGTGGGAFKDRPTEHRLTMPDIHRLIEEQTGWLTAGSFHPIPCSHPSCYTATYLFRLDDGTWRPLPDFVDVGQYLDAITNRGLLFADQDTEAMLLDAVNSLWSASAIGADSAEILESIRSFALEIYSSGSSGSRLDIERLAEGRLKSVFIHAFMDRHDLDVSRLKKCCNHYLLPDGRLMPGCAYNNLYRHRDPRFLPPR